MKNNFFLILFFFAKFLSAQTDQKTNVDSCNISFPNTLSENAGDQMTINCPCEIKALNFSLYNKAGQLKYSTTSIKNPMDLNIHLRTKTDGRGIPIYNNGIYYWVAKYDVLLRGKIVSKISQGTISIFSE